MEGAYNVKLLTNNIVKTSEIYSTGFMDGFHPDNIKNDNRAKEWRSGGNTFEWVMIDPGSFSDIDTVAIMWPKGEYKLSESAVITFQASALSDFSTIGFEQELTLDDRNELARLYLSEPISYRYYRITIEDPTNAHGFVNIGTLLMGLSQPILTRAGIGLEFSYRDNSETVITKYGQKFSFNYPKLKSLTIPLDNLSLEETEELIREFNLLGNTEPVFLTLDPDQALFTRGDFWIYGVITSSLNFNHVSRDIFSTSIGITEIN